MFKEMFTESSRIYRKDKKPWAYDNDIARYIRQKGLKEIAIGITKSLWKSGRDSEMVFVDLYSNEKNKENMVDLKSGERVCRYVSRTTAAGDMAPLCILNADKGYVKFMENDAEQPLDIIWSKPQKFEYLRTTY